MVAKDYRHIAWNKLTGKWGTFVLITIIAALIGGACGGTSYFGIGAIAAVLIAGPLNLGLSECYLKLVRGQNVEIVNMFDGFKNFLRAFLLQLVNGIFIALWSLLFVIPGIIKSYAYSMSFYILADNPEIDFNDARKKSIEMMNGNKWKLFCLDFSFIGWYILCILTLGILSLWVTPYHNAARAEFYQRLVSEKNGGVEYTQNNGGTGTQSEDGNQQWSGSVFGSDFEPEQDKKVDNDDPFGGEFTKGNDDEQPPLNADDL